jgi:peroxiredoxin-like protein
MTYIQANIKKSDKQFLFETNLNWITKKKGLMSAREVKGSLHVSTPVSFGGEGKDWSPEHLFLGSVSSCLMTTFLSFADKLNFKISRFECESIGQVHLVDGHYEFTNINLYPKIFIQDESIRDKAVQALQKAQKNCLITNSIRSAIIYHSEIIKEDSTEVITEGTAVH